MVVGGGGYVSFVFSLFCLFAIFIVFFSSDNKTSRMIIKYSPLILHVPALRTQTPLTNLLILILGA